MRAQPPKLRIALSFLLFCIVIPLVYNSCQSGLIGTRGFSSLSSSCRMNKGVVTKLESDAQTVAGAFRTSKVHLAEQPARRNLTTNKVYPARKLVAGARIALLMNNSCLQQKLFANEEHFFSKAVSQQGQMHSNLDRQAYEWTMDRDYSQRELEEFADQDPCVVGVSWNHEYQIQSFNDPGLLYQTHLTNIRATEAYPLFFNSSGGMDEVGNPVIVAVVDTGVDWQHPDLQSNMWTHNQGVGIDITTLNSGLVDFNPYDISSIGHGTHVAGLIAAIANNGVGVMGAMPYRAKIMAIRLFTSNANGELSTTSQHFYNALRFAYLNGAHVVNLSLGSVTAGPATDTLAEAGVTEALGNGLVVVTVIGNSTGGADGQEINGVTQSSIPAQYSTRNGVIGVGSYDVTSGTKSYFSHFSTTYAEIGAPGAEQGSTGLYSTLPRAMSSYGRLAGTSQAAPLVSAAAALTIGMIRDSYNNIPPSPAEVERLIIESAQKSAVLSQFFKNGNKLDLYGLVRKINQDYPLTRDKNQSGSPNYSCPP